MKIPKYKLVTGNAKKCQYSFTVYMDKNVSIAVSVDNDLITKSQEAILKKHLSAFCEEINQ